MSYRARISQLENLHRQLDSQIDAMERNHPHVEQVKLQEMKKNRLQYRDELSRLRKLQYEEDHERVNFDDER